MYSLRTNILILANAVDASEKRRREARKRRLARRLMRIDMNPFTDVPEAEFVKTFRLGKDSVRGLIDELTPLMTKPRRNDSISAEMKILIALAFYASGSYQNLIGQSALHNVSQITVSRSIKEVTEALNKIYHKYVKWPTQSDERNIIKAKFYQKFGFPGILGCIDGTHVAILRPHIHEERYYNRKGFHSLNVMIICDSDLNILCVDASTPGSAHDSTVWQSHPLSLHLKQITENTNEQVFLLGDSGYPLRKTMMTPILNTIEGTPQHHYYVKHVTARNTVERCIGVLKARFRCLLVARTLHYSPITAGKIVNACCVLHNIANTAREPLPSDEVYEEVLRLQQEENNYAAPNDQDHRRVNRDLLEGRALQQALVDRLWRDA
ncbi:putative nuclease HARBI1 [Spodoptera frugiperda]|uniref:Putative nuclease HARBI1 n=1 Tax=Spodoptera frugiperda TaxID=7108 RepID=A0A9R0CVF6_SPOFR|nr:putative nuclease HARBI1 [Spodoptera frugiperda]